MSATNAIPNINVIPEVQQQILQEDPQFIPGVAEDGFGMLRRSGEDPEELSQTVMRYTLTNTRGMCVQVLNYGVTIVSLTVADRTGTRDDVILGFEDLQTYQDNWDYYLGCALGRLANRVSGAKFQMDGRVYDLATREEGGAHVNGGVLGLSHVVWNSRVEGNTVVFTYLSRDGEEGYPGNLMVTTRVWLTNDNALHMVTSAMADQPTPCNITNHSRFNLAGHMKGPIALGEHVVVVNADKYLDATDEGLPTGEIKHVGCTLLDLRIHRLLSRLIPLVPRGGFEHSYCINGGRQDGVRFVARVLHPKSGRVLEIFSDQPVAHVSTSRDLPGVDEWETLPPVGDGVESLEVAEVVEEVGAPLTVQESGEFNDVWEDGEAGGEGSKEGDGGEPPKPKRVVVGKGGALYERHGAISVTPQGFPDAVNHRHFPDVILRPGENYTHTLIYKFSVALKTKKWAAEAADNTPTSPPPTEVEEAVGSEHSGGSRTSAVEAATEGEGGEA